LFGAEGAAGVFGVEGQDYLVEDSTKGYRHNKI